MQQRIRTTKPEFYRHFELFEAERETGLPLRIAYQALWTCCDREGRFRWRPQELKVLCLPYDNVDFSRVLDALATRGFVVKYACGTREFGCIPSFQRHQIINNREKASELPAFDDENAEVIEPQQLRRVDHACPTALSPAQAEREREREREREVEANASCAEPPTADSTPADGIEPFPTKDSKRRQWVLTESKLAEYRATYGADVLPECRKARQWLQDHPAKRKSYSGTVRFLTGWLNRANDGNRLATGPNSSRASPSQQREANTVAAVTNWQPPTKVIR